ERLFDHLAAEAAGLIREPKSARLVAGRRGPVRALRIPRPQPPNRALWPRQNDAPSLSSIRTPMLHCRGARIAEARPPRQSVLGSQPDPPPAPGVIVPHPRVPPGPLQRIGFHSLLNVPVL